MKRVALLLCLAPFAFAQDIDLPHTLSNNSVANADQVMANFNALKDGVNSRLRVDLRDLNVAIGNRALLQMATDPSNLQHNIAIGTDALRNSTNKLNVAIGSYSQYNNISGRYNVAIGQDSLQTNETGSSNTAVGTFALYSATGSFNTGLGYYALSGEEGSYNTAVGANALYNNNRNGNTAVGYGSLQQNTLGQLNTAVGQQASQNNSTGIENTAVGAKALISNTSGAYNIAIGTNAMSQMTSGDQNTAVGAYAGPSRSGLENTTSIGNGASVSASHTVRIGNGRILGIFANVELTSTSDARLKENIERVDSGLSLINDLNPVVYHRINNDAPDVEMGLLAQEVAATLEKHGLGNSGMVHQPTEGSYMSLRYNDLLAPMIRAIQELDNQHIVAIEQKDEQIALLEQKLETQKEELLAIVQSQQQQIAQLQRMVEHQFVAR